MFPLTSRIALAMRITSIVFALLGSAHAAPVLGFDEALQLAEQRSRALPAQEAAADAARQMAVAAAQRPDPTLKAGIDNLPVNGADRFSLTRDFMTMRTVGIAQDLTASDKRQARATRFEREADLALADRSDALAKLQRDTAGAWLARYHLLRVCELLRSQRDEAGLQVDAANAAYRGGRGSQADVFAARSLVAQIEDRLAQADNQVATAQTQLARWVGNAASLPSGDAPETDTVPWRSDDLNAQIAHHPTITRLAQQQAIAEADAQIAVANKRADWSVELSYAQRGSAYSNMVSINLAVPLQWDQKKRQDRELAATLSRVEQVKSEREEATRDHAAEVAAMLQEWQADRARLQRYDISLLPLAGERAEASATAYRSGGGTLSAALDARRAEIETRIERIRLEMETSRLWAQLNYLMPNQTPHAAGSKQ